MLFDPILVITRPKKNGLGIHFGVEFPGGTVYDYTVDEGFRQVSREHFADGQAVSVAKQIPWHMAPVVRTRLNELARNPKKYDLLSWNCETFAEWLTSGVPKSGQVAGAIVIAALALMLALLSRA